MDRDLGTAPAPSGAEAAHATDSLPDCGHPCNDLTEALCEDCESPVKGRDCAGWAACLAEAARGSLPCAWCHPATPKARALAQAMVLLREERERNRHEIGVVRALRSIVDVTMATLSGVAERLGAR